MMDNHYVQRIIYSALAILFATLLLHAFGRNARKTQQRLGLSDSRYYTMRRLMRFLYFGVLVLALTLIWGVNLKNIWVSVTGVMAMIAVAFFAVWSLIGNILAGFILYFAVPFRTDDSIEIVPDGVHGQVLSINTFYTLLEDEEGNKISVPNSLFFQKYVKRMKRTKTKQDIPFL
jgi:small-conductance mechanosensitive channel